MTRTTSAGRCKITNGQIIDTNGNAFTAAGLNVYDARIGDAAQTIVDSPGVNFVRLNVYSYQDPSAYAAFIQTMTSKDVVVELEGHTKSNGSSAGNGSGTVFPVSPLTNELNGYLAVAGAQTITSADGTVVWGWNSGANDNLTDGSGNLTTDG